MSCLQIPMSNPVSPWWEWSMELCNFKSILESNLYLGLRIPVLVCQGSLEYFIMAVMEERLAE